MNKLLKITEILITLCLASTALPAQTPQEVIVAAILRSGAGMQTMECDFVQTRTVQLMAEPMVSKGRMYYAQPSRLRWEYTNPVPSAFILDNSKAWVLNGGSVSDVSSNKMFKGLGRMLIGCLEGKVVDDDKSFQVEISESEDLWAVKLLPLKKDVKQMWDSIVLHFVPSRNAVVKVEMNEKTGDATVVELRNMKVNGKIDDKLFNTEL
ncbi:MAG: outer membrane lipoprotein carrier protein LolA [Candidatus Cryptobacteroides sp.]